MSAWLWFIFILGAIFNILCTIFPIEHSKALLGNSVYIKLHSMCPPFPSCNTVNSKNIGPLEENVLN